MDSLFVAACQGLGLALAVGVLAGASGRSDGIGTALEFVAAVAAAFLFRWSLDDNGHTAWPGYFVGAVAAIGAYIVARDVAAGASTRASATSLAVSGFIALSPSPSPASRSCTARLRSWASWLWWPSAWPSARAARKHEGLRVLR